MLLPVVVPILALPDSTAIPQKIPVVVVAPLLVYSAKPATVLPCISDTAPAAVKVQLMAIYLVALAVPVVVYEFGKVPVSATVLPIILVVPVPVLFA
jgi:hypothetical protein